MMSSNRYEFSFTGANLRLQDSVLIARSVLGEYELNITEDLGRGNSSTGKSIYAKLIKRIDALTPNQLELLVDGGLISQQQIAFLAVCKCHGFIRDFTLEVLREKHLVFDYEILESDYRSFYNRKIDNHPELEFLHDYTKKKIKQVTFRILQQAGMIDNVKSRQIQPQLLDTAIVKILVTDNPKWLKVFLMSDMDIKQAIITHDIDQSTI